MGKDEFDMPDMGDLAKQLEEAMGEAQKAIGQTLETADGSLGQLGGLGDILGALSGLGEGMPGQMEDLGAALGGFEEQHEANVESMVGDPDWELAAKITVGNKLEVALTAELSLATVQQAWSSTQGGGFEALVEETLVNDGVELESGEMGQVLEQLSRGRSVAAVTDLKVLVCHIQGAPDDAKDTLRLSPEANVPLVMDKAGLGFEFAPLLTIRNQWENADLPTFVPMGQEIVVPIDRFAKGEAFGFRAEPAGQDDKVVVELRLSPLG